MAEIPFSGVPKESMTVVLENRPIEIRSAYLNLLDAWTLDLFDVSADAPIPLVQGLVVAVGVDMLAPYALRLGGLFAIPNERPNEDPGVGELGVRVKIVHRTRAEMAEA